MIPKARSNIGPNGNPAILYLNPIMHDTAVALENHPPLTEF